MSKPLISVIIPTYNREKYISQAIGSVLGQAKDGFEIEIIIIDDGSTDNTEKLLDKYSGQVNYQKLERWGGPARPRNYGISIANGEYIAFLDTDDIWEKDKLAKEMKLMQEQNCDVVYSDGLVINEHGERTGEYFLAGANPKSGMIFEDLLQSNFITLSSSLIKKQVVEKAGGFVEDHKVGFEDYHFWLKLAASGTKFGFISEPLFSYRMHSSKYSREQMAQTSEQKQIIAVYKSLLKTNQLNSNQRKLVLKRIIKGNLHNLADNSESRAARLAAKSIRKAGRVAKRSAQIPSIQFEKRRLIKQIESASVSQGVKQKLLVVLPWMTVGGADKVILDLTAQLKSSYEIHFITTEPELGNEWHDRFAEVSQDIMHLPGMVKHDTNKPFYIGRYCEHHGIDKVMISNSISGYQAAKAIHKQGIKIVDILHGEGGKQDQGGAPKFMQPYERYIDRHITVTEYLKHYLEETYQNDPSKIYVIHNGVDTNFFDPSTASKSQTRKKLGLPQKGKVFCWIGRFSEEKQPEVFLDVAVKLSKLHKDINFVMGGNGPLYQSAESKLEQADNPSNIILLGQLEDARDTLAASDALVVTSSMEGLPIVMLEAGSMGVPVFAPTVGGIPEYIQNGHNGVLLKPGKEIENDLFKAASRYLEGERIWASKQIREYTKGNFSLDKMKQAYLEVLDF